jgi:hypothetical protein
MASVAMCQGTKSLRDSKSKQGSAWVLTRIEIAGSEGGSLS